MIVCSVEPHAEQRSGNRISGTSPCPVVISPARSSSTMWSHAAHAASTRCSRTGRWRRACSRPACAENLSQRVSVQRLIPTPFVVYFWGLKQPDFAGAAGLTEIICFPLSPPNGLSMAGTRVWRISDGGHTGGFAPTPVVQTRGAVSPKRPFAGAATNGWVGWEADTGQIKTTLPSLDSPGMLSHRWSRTAARLSPAG